MESEKIKIVLHIGQPKTGSSAIQGFLNYNREYLVKNHGILYPNFDNNNFGKGLQHNHGPFFVKSIKNDDFEGLLKTFKNSIKYCVSNNINKIVLSNEGFFWHWWPEFMRKIIDNLDIDINIILYLRRQDKYIESAWKQWGHKDPECNSIMDYVNKVNLNWYDYIKNWLKHFEPKDFIVQPFEKVAIGDDVVLNFMNILGIDNLSGFTKPPKINQIVNTGFSVDIIEILRLSKNLVKNEHDHSLLDFMFKMLSSEYRKDPMKNYNLLSPHERINIINRYEQSNNKIAKTFFIDKSQMLFNDPLPDVNEQWEPYNGLTIEKVVPIFLEILYRQNNEIMEMKKLISYKK